MVQKEERSTSVQVGIKLQDEEIIHFNNMLKFIDSVNNAILP